MMSEDDIADLMNSDVTHVTNVSALSCTAYKAGRPLGISAQHQI